jgi:hypothetical protein
LREHTTLNLDGAWFDRGVQFRTKLLKKRWMGEQIEYCVQHCCADTPRAGNESHGGLSRECHRVELRALHLLLISSSSCNQAGRAHKVKEQIVDLAARRLAALGHFEGCLEDYLGVIRG